LDTRGLVLVGVWLCFLSFFLFWVVNISLNFLAFWFELNHEVKIFGFYNKNKNKKRWRALQMEVETLKKTVSYAWYK